MLESERDQGQDPVTVLHSRPLAREKQRFAIGPESTKKLGCDTAEVDALPAQVTESFAGIGKPFALGELQNGDTELGFRQVLVEVIRALRLGTTSRCPISFWTMR